MAVKDLDHPVHQWLDWDQDPATREEIVSLWKRATASGHDASLAVEELQRRLGGYIRFGTAGLRGRMQAGFCFINCLTIIQASQGLADYLVTSSFAPSKSHSVVLGYDTRHNSVRFAGLAANAFRAKGIEVLAFGSYVPTPLVAFSVKVTGAIAGVMVTASHNPAQDNGYKVYQAEGVQINAPVDHEIAAKIADNLKPWEGAWNSSQINDDNSDFLRIMLMRYEETLLGRRQLSGLDWHNRTPSTRAVYTPMHGVGGSLVPEILLKVNRCSLIPVPQQMLPDPNFSTVKFPNPEEDGALSLAFAAAEEIGEDTVIANDPDADRFAVAQKVSGSWQRLTGDQVGVLLGDYLIEVEQSQANDKSEVMMICSTVSSRMLEKILTAAGQRFHFSETLTGFKWIGQEAQRCQKAGYKVVFGYEEALGYMFPEVSWDKDGIAAASTFLSARSLWMKQGLDPWTKLQQLYQKHGYHESINTYFISTDPSYTAAIFSKIRDSEELRHAVLGLYKIEAWREPPTRAEFGKWSTTLPMEDSGKMMQFQLTQCTGSGPDPDSLARATEIFFTLRASGTEPKLKLYLECSAPTEEEAALHASQTFAAILSHWISRFGPNLKHSGTAKSSSGRVVDAVIG